jgi:3-methyladenine DNA glycosylase AlkD
MTGPSRAELLAELSAIASVNEVAKVARFYEGGDPEARVLGVSIGRIFPVAKRYADLPLEDVERLVEDERYEVRMAATAILDFKARRKGLTAEDRAALLDLYLRRHDRIDNRDLVDRAAPPVVGEALVDGDRSMLDRLARSDDPNRRRTALVATHAFVKRGEVADTVRIAARLADDPDPYVQKAIASWPRDAGKKDPEALAAFLDEHADKLPKGTVTAASRGRGGAATRAGQPPEDLASAARHGTSACQECRTATAAGQRRPGTVTWRAMRTGTTLDRPGCETGEGGSSLRQMGFDRAVVADLRLA